jgi:hypothetical protein
MSFGAGWEWVAGVFGALAVVGARPLARRLAEPLRGVEGRWSVDIALVLAALLFTLPTLLRVWTKLSPYDSPMGPDADGNFLAAVAIARDAPALYAGDRYPAYAALVSALAQLGAPLHVAGAWLSRGCAIGAAIAAYVLGRQLGGRVAGLVGILVALRLPGLVDTGRQFTPYALVALLDVGSVVLLVALARGRRVGVPLALVAALAFTADPKQVPVALVVVALGIGLALRRRGWVQALVLAAALPLADAGVGASGLPILGLVDITSRVDVGLSLGAATDWRLGDPLWRLPGALLALARAAPADRGWLDPLALHGLPMELPGTSVVWSLGLLALPVAWRLRRRPAGELLALAPLLLVAWSTLHLHFQHRYFVPLGVVAPVLVASALALLFGPLVPAAVCAVALLWPGSPWRSVGPGVLDPAPNGAEGWTGVEPPEWGFTYGLAAERFPADAEVFDFSASRPWEMLAAGWPYTRCTTTKDQCRVALAGAFGTPIVVLVPGEAGSDAVSGVSGLTAGGAPPMQAGPCWTRALMRPGAGAAYQWSCAGRPELGPVPAPTRGAVR